ncbi:MAG TPA: DUF6596 domain-containing protein [Kutzneria sp.]
MTTDREVEDLLRRLAPQVLGILMRRYGDFDACEDAVQEALVAAAAQWRAAGLPDNPRAWLLTVASRRLTDEYRKQRIKASGQLFAALDGERDERMRVVRHVLYLIFNEGYATTAGPELHRADLTVEPIRLTRQRHELRPADPENTGLLALMLLTEARRPARTAPDGLPIPLDEQDRARWDRAAVEEGTALLTEALAEGAAGPYQLQAAIAAVHADAGRAEDTDWPQILGLYDVLQRISSSPVVALNRAVAVAMVQGPRAALGLLGSLESDERLAASHRLEAARAHMLEMADDRDATISSPSCVRNVVASPARRRRSPSTRTPRSSIRLAQDRTARIWASISSGVASSDSSTQTISRYFTARTPCRDWSSATYQ